jgi:hypothetical protein
MRYIIALLTMLMCAPAMARDDLILPKVEFSATAVHDVGATQTKETLHYSNGKLRIDRENGFSSTILDLTTQTQCLLMVNHTYLVLPMDDELFRRYFARSAAMSGARKVGAKRIDGLETTKYAFGDDGALDAAGSYWLTSTGIMMRREYQNGVFGQDTHHLEYLTHLRVEKQPAELFVIPRGYKIAK